MKPVCRRALAIARSARGRHRQQRAGSVVREHLRGADQEQRDEHHRHRHHAGHDRQRQQHQDGRAQQIDGDDDEPPVEAVRQRAREQAEQQPRELLQQDRRCDEQRVAGLRGDQQRAGREGDAVAEVRDPGGGEQPAEAGPEACRCHDLPDAAHLTGR
jgi:hypothetical protein